MSIAVVGLAVMAMAGACQVLSSATRSEPRCSPPAGDFSEADLVGTWMAGRTRATSL